MYKVKAHVYGSAWHVLTVYFHSFKTVVGEKRETETDLHTESERQRERMAFLWL